MLAHWGRNTHLDQWSRLVRIIRLVDILVHSLVVWLQLFGVEGSRSELRFIVVKLDQCKTSHGAIQALIWRPVLYWLPCLLSGIKCAPLDWCWHSYRRLVGKWKMDVECTNCTCGGEGIQVVCVFCAKTSLCGWKIGHAPVIKEWGQPCSQEFVWFRSGSKLCPGHVLLVSSSAVDTPVSTQDYRIC